MDAAINDAPLDAQISVGAHEADLLLEAPREGVPPVLRQRAAEAIHNDGLCTVDSVVSQSAAWALLTHVNHRLGESLCSDEKSGEAMLGAILCRQHRHDLKLDLGVPSVHGALTAALAALGTPLTTLLGSGAELFELGALVSDDGAPQQPLHPDVPWHSRLTVVTAVVALQDVDKSMGPTLYLPRTHTERSRAALWGFDPQDDDEIAGMLSQSALRIPLLRAGDCILFDARTMHCGGANTSGKRRVLFYFSFRRRRALALPLHLHLVGCARMLLARVQTALASRFAQELRTHASPAASGEEWRGGGFDQPGTLLDSLRGKYCLASDGTLEECTLGSSNSSSSSSSSSSADASWLFTYLYVSSMMSSRSAMPMALAAAVAACWMAGGCSGRFTEFTVF